MKDSCGKSCSNHSGIRSEIIAHFPFAILSVALSMIVLSFLFSTKTSSESAHSLFHSFHFLHLLFSGTGVIITFNRYSKNLIGGILTGLFVPAIFCTLSDSILPYLGGYFLSLDMKFHWCFINHLHMVLPFLIFGIINGYLLSDHGEAKQIFYSKGSHFLHIFISSMASILYLAGYGFSEWESYMGFVFVFLVLAVLIPCTLADIVVPTIFAKMKKKPINKVKSCDCDD